TIYYLPKPLKFPINYPVGDDLEFAKEYKKMRFLPLSIWQRWYQGNGFEESDRQELIAKVKGDKEYAPKTLENSCVFSYGKTHAFEKQPKVAIDRLTRATNLYYTSFVRYRSEEQNKSGLYFLIQLNDTSLENDLKAALALLGDEGLGGERSSGAGRFTPSWDELHKLPDQTWQNVINFSEGNCHSLMSLYWDDSIISLTNSSYELQERGGWIASPFSGRQLRRKSVKMFTEGSTFIEIPRGKLADVTPRDDKDIAIFILLWYSFRAQSLAPLRWNVLRWINNRCNRLSDHDIYRSGISLSIPIKVSEE
ncbi:MAG: type III-A CRISPR-associated RAMP protein Csm4, partial [Coleofasciculaceae cyanobacterium SM2_1_6]|nr:type III-A CRISPR-associated RAMP protein Csm4 [Coleofasciculaceae cyanobacterium SM2_1_6]